MMFNRFSVLNCRLFVTSRPVLTQGTDLSKYKDGKYIKKFLSKRGAKEKKNWYKPFLAEPLELPKHEHQTTFTKTETKVPVLDVQSTKNRQLSHVLYDAIVDIINSGELSESLLGKQVFITSVRMHRRHTGMNVYWDADRQDAAEVEQLLFAYSSKLRQLLISYHVLGRIPPVTFKRGKSQNFSKLHELFEKADYGPDYKPGLKPTITGTPYCNDGDDTFLGDSEKILGLKVSSEQRNIFYYNEHSPANVAPVELPEKTSFCGKNKDKEFCLLLEKREQEYFIEKNLAKKEIHQTDESSVGRNIQDNNNSLQIENKEQCTNIGAQINIEKNQTEQSEEKSIGCAYNGSEDLNNKTKEYFSDNEMFYHKNMYSLPHEDIINKILRKKHPKSYQIKEKVMPTSQDVYDKIISSQKNKQKEDYHLKFGNKLKQRILQMDNTEESY